MAKLRTVGLGLMVSSATALVMLGACGGSDDTNFGGGKDAGLGGASGAAGQGGAGPECGNSDVELGEECDDGNLDSGDGCENDCYFSCVAGNPARDKCDDDNPCNGVETCGTDNACAPGTPLAENADCGDGNVCVGGNCVSASCGDGQPQTGEECDDGDVDETNGCTTQCKFTCLSTDSTRDCSSTGDECAGTNVCDDTAHTCTGGTAKSENDPCNGGAGYCKAGVCTTAVCGNSTTEPGEDCDDGNTDDADGCTTLCKFSCTAASQCNDNNPCTQNNCTQNKCAYPANTSQNGNACTVGSVTGTCQNGACVPANCGNGTVQSGEQCDKGAQNGVPGSGCTASCQFQCNTNANCSDNNLCNGSETCIDVTGGKTCQAGTPPAQGTVCQASPRSICDTGQCKLSLCGDGYLDTGGGEQCEPPNTATCSAQCQTIAAAACGNGTIEGTEQCDDGNTTNLDGCDSQCKYEVMHRLSKVEIMGGTAPAFCTPTTNRLGNTALTSTARNQINPSLQDGINEGTTNVIVQALGLDDLTGTADPSLELGIMTGILDPAKGTYPAGNPIDWWFLIAPSTIDANRLPTGKLSASLAAKTVTAGPANVLLTLLLAGSPAVLEMRSARITATTVGTPSTPAPPPNQLAAGLVVFPDIKGDGTGQGLCGNITVESLSQIPIPESLTSGSTPCRAQCSNSEAYTYCGANQPVGPGCNSLLDALVGGCRASILCITAINKTQPDVPAGSSVQTLTLGANNKVPTSQTAGNKDAYSSYMCFYGKRTHATGVNQ